MDRALIDRYEQGGDLLAAAVDGLSQEQLHAHPVPGTWSIHQIVVHLMDSDLIASDRMKRLASMPKPLLMGYDETAFANLPGQDEVDARTACEIFRLNRQVTARVLRRLPNEAYERVGIHSENGKITLAHVVPAYIQHLDHHLEFIAKKRAMLTNK
jgi:uncharacterized damage-inducible protein DinB